MTLRFALLMVLLALPLPAAARTLVVTPRHSIQAAVDRALAGDRIEIHPGTYHERGRPCPTDPDKTCAVVIAKDGIALVGLSRPGELVVLEARGGQDTGIAVAVLGAEGASCAQDAGDRIQGSRISGVRVRGFGESGIRLVCVDHFQIEHADALDDGDYGIFPSDCGDGVVRDSLVRGNEAGIFLGQSHDVRVERNTVTGNGAGIVAAGGAGNLLRGNWVNDNRDTGIGVTDVCAAAQVPPEECGDPGADALPADTQVVHNTAQGNGTDVTWNGTGEGLCWRDNLGDTVDAPGELPVCK